jgi:hypothetical protein
VRLSDVNSGLFVVLDDKNELSLSAVGNGSVTLASAMLALYDIRSLMDVISKPNFPVMVLIDEIGAGIHYSVMRDIWAFVKKFSQQNPQIQFVTTSHNDDCVRAFCETFIDYSSASIVRLSRNAS